MTRNTLILAPIILLTAGCGGSSSSGVSQVAPVGSGLGILTVNWPPRDRAIPAAANSLTVTLKLKGQVVSAKTLSRPSGDSPTTNTTFDGLAYGTYTLEVNAYPTTDGLNTNPSAVAQALGSGSMTVKEDLPGTATITLASTVAQLVISSTTVDKGKTVGLTASATNPKGEIVLLSAGGGSETLEWSTGAATIATVAGTGPTATLTGVHSGDTTVKVVLIGTDGKTIIASPSTPVKVNVIDDGTGTVIIK